MMSLINSDEDDQKHRTLGMIIDAIGLGIAIQDIALACRHYHQTRPFSTNLPHNKTNNYNSQPNLPCVFMQLLLRPTSRNQVQETAIVAYSLYQESGFFASDFGVTRTLQHGPPIPVTVSAYPKPGSTVRYINSTADSIADAVAHSGVVPTLQYASSPHCTSSPHTLGPPHAKSVPPTAHRLAPAYTTPGPDIA
eukprot:198980-Rhodomonas_salina.2